MESTTNIWQQLSSELSGAVERVGKSIVAVDGRAGHTSSGILWRPNLVLTAAHTVRSESGIRVIADSNTAVQARLAGRDPGSDIALLRLDQDLALPVASFGNTDSLAIGQFVIAVARTRRGHIVASAGILSGLMGEWRTWRGSRFERFIRPDLTLYSGFSGGALVGSDGLVLGMNTRGLMRDKPITVPASTLTRIGEALETRGRVPRPFIGLVMQPVHVPESLQKRSGVAARSGLLVMQTEPGGPAEQAGIVIGDLLIELDGNAFADLDNVADLLSRSGIGNEAKLTLIRGGARLNVNVRVGER
jgi:S1-C subfamily serine protease